MKISLVARGSPGLTLPLAMLMVGGSIFVATSSSAPAGCERVEPASIRESMQFTPADQRRGGARPERPIAQTMPRLQSADSILQLPESIDGLGVQHVSSMAPGSVYLFYWDAPIAADLTPAKFYASGGVAFLLEPRGDGESFADSLPGLIGDRATKVDIGPHRGVLTWADPTVDGVRTHNLYWADETTNYSLIGVREPDRIVNLARGIVCS